MELLEGPGSLTTVTTFVTTAGSLRFDCQRERRDLLSHGVSRHSPQGRHRLASPWTSNWAVMGMDIDHPIDKQVKNHGSTGMHAGSCNGHEPRAVLEPVRRPDAGDPIDHLNSHTGGPHGSSGSTSVRTGGHSP